MQILGDCSFVIFMTPLSLTCITALQQFCLSVAGINHRYYLSLSTSISSMLRGNFINILFLSHFPSSSEVKSFIFPLFLFFHSEKKIPCNIELFVKALKLCCIRISFVTAELYHWMFCSCSLFYQFHNLCNMDPLYLSPIFSFFLRMFNPLNAELNSIFYLLALLGAHHFLYVSRIRVKSLTLRLLMSYIYIYIYIYIHI